MSLNREQWLAMWESITKIELLTHKITAPLHRRQMQKEIDKIKTQIQSVIGQLE